MKTSSIADAKNHLSSLIHQIESGDPIHLTRYGKPVVVIMSEQDYIQLISPVTDLNAGIQQWRNQMKGNKHSGFSDNELIKLRQSSSEREFVWEE